MHYVYFLSCSDETIYVGCTNNLIDRIKRHRQKRVIATSKRLPVKLIAYFGINDKSKAYKLEKYFKSGSGRTFIKKHL